MKLTMLKPRVQQANTSRVQGIAGEGWRQGKDGSTARGYTYRWQKARERFLRLHPLCVECKKTARLTAATVVDHIIPHRGDEQLFWDETNWQSLCKPHHDAKTAAGE